jgi:hypothetical protein
LADDVRIDEDDLPGYFEYNQKQSPFHAPDDDVIQELSSRDEVSQSQSEQKKNGQN